MGAILTPDVGSPILPTDPVVFDVTDADETLTDLLITVRHDTGVVELVHNGATFTAFYAAGSTRTPVTDGYHFSIVRAGGWVDTRVTFSAYPFANGDGSLINFSSDFDVVDDPPNEDVALSVTGVAAGAYGDSTHVGRFTTDSKGRVTAAASIAIDFSAAIATAEAFATAAVAAEAVLRIAGDAASVTTAENFATAAVAAEAVLRIAGDAASVTTAENFATAAVAAEAVLRIAGDASTLSTAQGFATAAVAAEAVLRIAGDAASVATAEGFATAADAALLASIRQPKRGEYWVYCLDYDGAGNDTTGAPGISTTKAAAIAAAAATPFKTYERMAQVRPSTGHGATLVELAKPRTSGAPYRNMANSADQDGSWLNWLSNWHFLSRGSLDFANDTNDKIRAGFLTASGTNAPGYKVTASSNTDGSSTLTCVLAGGGAPGFTTESGGFSAITGIRIRGLATNPTAALQNFCVGIQKNSSTTLGTMATLPATPLPPSDPSGGDIFVIETPGVTVANLTHFAGYNRTFCLVGLNATGTSAINHQTPTSRIAGCNFTQANFSDGEIFSALTSYVDEDDANITVGYGLRCSTGLSLNSTKSITISASSWLGATQMTVGATVLSSSVGSGCVTPQGYRNNSTFGPSVTLIGNFGSTTVSKFRITGANIGGTAGIHCGGLGARIFGVDFGHCTTGCVALDSANAGAGKYYLDGLSSVDGGNVGGVSPNESFILRTTGIKQEDGMTVFVGSVVANTAVADRDIVSDGGVRGRFSDLASQNLAIRGIHIYGGNALAFDPFNDSVLGPTTLIETHNTSFYTNGPFPPFRVINFIGYPNGPLTAPVALPAIADTIANCKAVAGVSLNYVWAAGDLWSCAQAGPVKIEFVAGQLTNITGGEMAYLSELGGADSGKARVGPPPTGIVIPLGPIQFHSDNVATPNTAMVNLIGFGPAFVARDGHAAESIVANPTAAVGSAADVGISPDSVPGRIGTGHVVGNISMTAAGRAMSGAASATAQTALLDLATAGVKGLAPARSGPAGSYLDITGGYSVPPGTGAGAITSTTGDVVASGPGAATATIQPGVVTNAKHANMAANSISSNLTGSPAPPVDNTFAAVKSALAFAFADVSGTLQAAQFPALTGHVTTIAGSLATTIASIPFSPLQTALAAASADLSVNSHKITNLLDPTNPQDAATRAFVLAQFSGGVPLVDGDKTDITVSGSGATWTIDSKAVTFPKLQDISTQTLIGRGTALTGAPESIGVTGGIEFSGLNLRRSAVTGDVTIPAGSGVSTIASLPFGVLQTALAAASGAINVNGQQITGAADPTTAQALATKAYVDALLAGLRWKQPVVVTISTAVVLATDVANGQVREGVTLSTGMRIALIAQTAGAENGIWIVNPSGAPTRSTDADTALELVSCAFFTQQGSTNADKAFVCNNDTITIGVTAITFVPFASVVGALIATNNLSDLTNPSAARTNLGLVALASSGSATDITAGTLAAARLAASGVAAATYGDASHVPVFTVDIAGRITNVVNTAISIAAGSVSGLAPIAISGSASDLTTGTVPFARLSGVEVPLTFVNGVTRSVNTIRNDLITGKSGGQIITGGTVDFDNLLIQSNNATFKGSIILDSTTFFTGRAGLGSGHKLGLVDTISTTNVDWQIGYELSPSGAVVVSSDAAVHTVFNGSASGLMVRNSSGVSLLEIKGADGTTRIAGPTGIQATPVSRYFLYAIGNATNDRVAIVVGAGPTLGSQGGLYAQIEMASGSTFVTPSATFTDLAHVHIGAPAWVDPSGASSVSGTVATVLIEGAPGLTNFDASANNRKYALNVKSGNVLINDILTIGTQLNVPDIHGTSAIFGGSGSVRFDGTIGFYATSPIAKPTVAGSRSGNAALQSLCTALANLGLITNSTT